MEDKRKSKNAELMLTYGCMLLWIFLSAAVILLNKYILSVAGFPYPIALTCSHMAFGAALSWAMVKGGLVEASPLSMDTYTTCILPIGLLFAATLWLGNAAYLYLSVSFIQMLKASMPMAVYVVGILFKTERYSLGSLGNILVVGLGIIIASYGEVMFVARGVLLQCASIVSESFRLTLVQIFLQRRGIKLNPVSTLYHIAPVCFAFLAIPCIMLELPAMSAAHASGELVLDVPLLFGSAASAFALNMSVFLLIGRSSALTMNVAGVVKDWLLILLSVLIYGSPVTGTQVFGYSIAFCGVGYYNYKKIQAAKQASEKPAPSDKSGEEGGTSKQSQ